MIKRPARLELTTLPRDGLRVTGPLRKALVSSFNYCRAYPRKLELFTEILQFVLDYAKWYQRAVEKWEEDRENRLGAAAARKLYEADMIKADQTRKAEAIARKTAPISTVVGEAVSSVGELFKGE